MEARVRSVVIVEDDPFLSLHLEGVLEDAGYVVLASANSVEAGLRALGDAFPDVAVLDVNLRGTLVFPVAEKLNEMGVPFVFVTAYANDDDLFPASLRAAPRLNKPVDEAALLAKLEHVVD